MKNYLLLFAMYMPPTMLGGAVLIWLSRGVGFLEAIDLSVGVLLTSSNVIWILICPFAWIYYLYDRRKQSSPKLSVQQQTATSGPITNTEPGTKCYEQALAELDSDERDSGIWAKAYAEADSEEASRKLYVKLRAADLMREQVEESTREVIREITPEETKKNAEEKKRDKKDNWAVPVVVITLILLFIGAYVTSDDSRPNKSFDFDTFREETSLNGISPEAAEEIINIADSADFSPIEDAYGGILGTDLQISQQLDADPQRREIVGKVLVDTILESMELPIQLDDVTILTGISYEVANSAVVYHYTVTADWSGMTDEALEDLRDEVEAFNPDATCKVSLSLLKQGFDMVYSYRTVAGNEMFRVTRDYEGCQSLGFS